MPDPTRETISATESAALFGVSPYATRWMLYQRFAKGADIDATEDARMSWGKKLQPLVLAQAAEDLALEVHPNDGDTYHRRGLLGCTRDGEIICPDRGPGAIETKCVFDYRTWMTDWAGGDRPPRRHEIQLQHQMFVGGGRGPSYNWGVLVAWVAGEQHYFEREPITDLWRAINTEAATFFDDVKAGNEPDPFGQLIELPLLNELFPTVPDKVLDLSADVDAAKLSDKAAMFKHYKDSENGYKRTAEKLRAEFLALAKDNETVLLPAGIVIRVSPTKNGKRLNVHVPEFAKPAPGSTIPLEEILRAG
jgi:hypothetical protein